MRHYTAPHPFAPLTDGEWATLAPFLQNPGPGRPRRNPREALDAIFVALLANRPWSHQGPAALSLHRKFRRWSHTRLWTRLLTALPETPALKPSNTESAAPTAPPSACCASPASPSPAASASSPPSPRPRNGCRTQ